MQNEAKIEPRGAAQKETGNLSFAAFLYMKGFKIVKATQSRARGNVEYSFLIDDPDDQWDELSIEFANSESSRFDNAVRTLKQLCRRRTRQ
jgi:hypothetical protein